MKCFNRKRLASSLAASAIVAAATLAPVSGIFTSGVAHAAARTDFVHIHSPARYISGTSVNVTLTYRCAPTTPLPSTTPSSKETLKVFVTQADPGALGGPTTASNPPVLCNDQINTVVVSVSSNSTAAPAVTITPPLNGNYNLGALNVNAQLSDGNGTLTATSSRVVRVVS
jgi:hypothetical protein